MRLFFPFSIIVVAIFCCFCGGGGGGGCAAKFHCYCPGDCAHQCDDDFFIVGKVLPISIRNVLTTGTIQ